ncbi:MAG: hypothetical protein H0Z33_14420 [Bacillaceae bacterium]|nr:hypothetical protein [Bacillaceae bacterium]
MIRDEDFLTVDQVLAQIEYALDEKTPFSLVRVGDAENLILAQDTVMSLEQVMAEKWARKAKAGKKGIRFPDLTLRDRVVESLKKADIMGIPYRDDDKIRVSKRLKRELTDQVFDYFDIQPKAVCHTFVTRVFPQKKKFWKVLRGKRVALISRWAPKLEKIITKKPYRQTVTLTIPFSHYDQMEETLDLLERKKDEFDIALISCGVNAVILSQQTAEMTGNVAIDFGKSSSYMVKGEAGIGKGSSRANLDLLD